jgi:hypothetical protein
MMCGRTTPKSPRREFCRLEANAPPSTKLPDVVLLSRVLTNLPALATSLRGIRLSDRICLRPLSRTLEQAPQPQPSERDSDRRRSPNSFKG